MTSAPNPPAELGVGLVWWPALDPLCRAGAGLVDVIEVEPEAYWLPAPGGGFDSYLPQDLVDRPQPKLLHGVGGVLAGTCPPPPGHDAALARDIAALRPAIVSDHLNLTHFRPQTDDEPIFAGFMLPPLQSVAGVALAAANIRRRQAAAGGVPVAVETPVSYLPPAPGEQQDGAFVAAVIEAAGCGLLLDLHNLLCNARNGRQGVRDYCAALPLERVWELHLAGGEAEAGFWLDAHAGVAEAELMELAAWLVPQLPNLSAMVFEIVPERVDAIGLDAVAGQLQAMRGLWERRGAAAVARPRNTLAADGPAIDPETWERMLGAALVGAPHFHVAGALADWWAACEPGLDLYRTLAGEARASAVAAAAPQTTRALLASRGGGATRRILADFWRVAPPGQMAIDEARSFLRYLTETQADSGLALVNAIEADASLLGGLDPCGTANAPPPSLAAAPIPGRAPRADRSRPLG